LNENGVRQLVRRILHESDKPAKIPSEEPAIVTNAREIISTNKFLKDEVVRESDLIEKKDSNYVIFLPASAAKHIKDRHSDPKKPGSTIDTSVNIREIFEKLLEESPTEVAGDRVKWLGVDVGMTVGGMGVAATDPAEVKSMQDYQMPDGRHETVKIRPGQRVPTSKVSLVAASLGRLSDGRELLSVITVFPGGDEVDGVRIPMDRNEFAAQGLYFVVESAKRSEDSIILERWQRLAGLKLNG
jgi:hypothetical protein